MTTLREAAQQALEALELYVPKEDYENKPVGNVMDALRAALAEPVQEPDSPERRCGGPGCDGTCCQPVEEPVAWIEHEWAGTGLRKLHFEKRDPTVRDEVVNPVWTPLYTAPPQRKPLAEWQINDLMADIDPEDRDSWSFRQGVYAAEKHHGVRK